jgi:hypothetical protein
VPGRLPRQSARLGHISSHTLRILSDPATGLWELPGLTSSPYLAQFWGLATQTVAANLEEKPYGYPKLPACLDSEAQPRTDHGGCA